MGKDKQLIDFGNNANFSADCIKYVRIMYLDDYKAIGMYFSTTGKRQYATIGDKFIFDDNGLSETYTITKLDGTYDIIYAVNKEADIMDIDATYKTLQKQIIRAALSNLKGDK